jgi:hypothetical protein
MSTEGGKRNCIIRVLPAGEREYPLQVAPPETELEMVQRHVRQGARCLAGQREMLTYLQKHGYRTELAETLLLSFEDVQVLHQEHLARLEPAEPPRV